MGVAIKVFCTRVVLLAVLLALCACSVGAAAPQSASDGVPASGAAGDSIAVTLKQWSVVPSATAASSAGGAVTFTVTNRGTIPHEFVVLRTDTRAAAIPVSSYEGEAGRLDEDTAGENVGETGDLDPGTVKTLALRLQPGHYVFFCNLPGHYGNGMHTDFTV
jgi:uncharacterized cupredoxin-like copper-binding protein